VEQYSDGRFVYVLKEKDKNYLIGFVDTTSQMTMKYSDPMLFLQRPLKYGDTLTDSFTTEYSIKGLTFKGHGLATIIADSYGELILPGKTYKHVLRLKITQEQNDTLTQYSSVTKTKTVTYAWFDKEHTSALLKLSETQSAYRTYKSVEYLLKETY
jgi:hypothetical protein